MLTAAQQAALEHVRESARPRPRGGAGQHEAVRRHRIAFNFHPDRIARDGRLVIQALLDDGVYRNQFETGISNGGLGGERPDWERRLFGGAYDGAPPEERPKYGGLNVLDNPYGPCPRFGSCHLVLHAHVAERTTFCFGDSHTAVRDVGTADAFDAVWAAFQAAPHDDPRDLDDYIEAQVHGLVGLGVDAAALVADPSFEGTDVGRLLQATADRYGIPLTHHAGFELDAADVPADFRGRETRDLALALGGRLNAERLGPAARAAAAAGDAARLQLVKYLWHVVVRFGQPVIRRGG